MSGNIQNTSNNNEYQNPIPSNVTLGWIMKNLPLSGFISGIAIILLTFTAGFNASEYIKNANATLANKTTEDNYVLKGELQSQKFTITKLEDQNKELVKELKSKQDTVSSLQDENKGLISRLNTAQESINSLNNKNNELNIKLDDAENEKQSLESIIATEKRNIQDHQLTIEKLNKQLELISSTPKQKLIPPHYEKVLSLGEMWSDPHSGITLELIRIAGLAGNIEYTVTVNLPNSRPFKKDVKTGTVWNYTNNGVSYKSTITWLDLEDKSITVTIDKI